MPSFQRFEQRIEVKGDENQHEQTDIWCNRDLIPLPPSRRTWGVMEYFGYWALNFLNVSAWQTPNSFLEEGLSVGQALAAFIVGNILIGAFSTLIAFCGLKWHIGFTIQSRISWGLRGSWIPLIQRIFLNFIWNAVQCWNGGRLITVCITAIWPSFNTMTNTLSSNMPTTTSQFLGFAIFWLISVPFLWVRPERFGKIFRWTSSTCIVAMFIVMIWTVSEAKGLGEVFYQSNSVSSSGSSWSTVWLVFSGINSTIGGSAAGVTNASDFGRYGRSPKSFLIATFLSSVLVGTLVGVVGMISTAAGQKAYEEVYWNPPDLLMRMMSDGNGTAGARAGIFIVSAAFAFSNMFLNICGNAVAGGIDLSGLFPRYINLRRGALITFFAAWIVMPWQLVNRAVTFLSVLDSFSVFLSPLIGIMACDYYLVRNQKVRLHDLYHKNSSYWYTGGVNWRAIPPWLIGWGVTLPGLIMDVSIDVKSNRSVLKVYNISFFVGFAIGFALFYLLNKISPPSGAGEYDEQDHYGAFTEAEASKLGIIMASLISAASDDENKDAIVIVGEIPERSGNVTSKLRGFFQKESDI